MNHNNEQDLAARFLKANRHEVADGGFTERVIEHLPRRYERIVLTLRVVGIVAILALFIGLGGVELVTDYCRNIFHCLLAGDWENTQLHSLAILIAGLSVAVICNLSFQEE